MNGLQDLTTPSCTLTSATWDGTVKLVVSDRVWAKKSGLCIEEVVFKWGAKIYVVTAIGT